jgi:hypothetical protein
MCYCLPLQVLDPGVEYIKSGAEPKTLAASAAAGFCNGLCPVLGEIVVIAGAWCGGPCLSSVVYTNKAGSSAGVSAGLTMLMVLASRGALHGPMALLANFISVPVEVTDACSSALRARSRLEL